jgi:hypothetical protein
MNDVELFIAYVRVFNTVTSFRVSVVSISVYIKAASTSETSADFYQTTWRNNPEDSRLHTGRRENLKSHLDLYYSYFSLMKNSPLSRFLHKMINIGQLITQLIDLEKCSQSHFYSL